MEERVSKLLRLLFVVFASLCSLVRAETQDLDKYRVYVSKVDDEFHSIALSNGMILQVVQMKWGLEKFLVAGDEILILPMLRHLERKESLKNEGDLLLISFGDQQKIINVWVTEESNFQMPTYASGSSLCLKPAGWLSSEQRLSVFELSDGSKWSIEDPALQDWVHLFAKKGDRIVISHSPSLDRWVFVNIDHLLEFKDDSKETLGYYSAIGVRPYTE
jgi:hypothetical protein